MQRCRVLQVAAVLVCYALIVCLMLLPLASIGNYRQWEMDTNSGDMRERRYLLRLLVWERIEQTEFSKLARHFSLDQRPPRWLLVCRKTAGIFDIFVGLPDSGFGGRVASACKNLVFKFELEDYDDEEKKRAVSHFLDLMRHENIKDNIKVMNEAIEIPKWTGSAETGR